MPATQILAIGAPGNGKSSAWEYMNPEDTLIVSPNAKPLPWKGSAKQYIVGKNRIQTDKITNLVPVLQKVSTDMKNIKHVLVEDLNHFYNARTTSTEFLNRKAQGEAFAKWGELGAEIVQLLKASIDFRDDLVIVINAHTEKHEDGTIGMLSPGKLLDREVIPTSYFTYVLHSIVRKTEKGIEYGFLTNKDGVHDAKTPRGCFNDLFIPNNMKNIIETIKGYQGD